MTNNMMKKTFSYYRGWAEAVALVLLGVALSAYGIWTLATTTLPIGVFVLVAVVIVLALVATFFAAKVTVVLARQEWEMELLVRKNYLADVERGLLSAE